MPPNLILTDEFKAALELLENGQDHVFLTGNAGTGKSTLLKYFICNTQKKVVVLSPTGVAALNVGGSTIHKFFGFSSDVTVSTVRRVRNPDVIDEVDIIVIDEVSMVRADLMDCIDVALRLNRGNDIPFGNVKMVFMGDLFQLPPVVVANEKEIFKTIYDSPYFFDAKVFRKILFDFIELTSIFRQKDESFVKILNEVRNKKMSIFSLIALNKRVRTNYSPTADDGYIYLTTTNAKVKQINVDYIDSIKSDPVISYARITGDVPQAYHVVDDKLIMKENAQVMICMNDPDGRWVNGTTGKIVGFVEGVPLVDLDNGGIYPIGPHEWKITEYALQSERHRRDEFGKIVKDRYGDPIVEEESKIVSVTIGVFTQIPLKVCKAITVHKAQGKTFNKVLLDVDTGTFSHGQLYVALSRCTALEGLLLKKEIEQWHVQIDPRVVGFMKALRANL